MVSFDAAILTVRPDVIVVRDWRNSLYEVPVDDESSEGEFEVAVLTDLTH